MSGVAPVLVLRPGTVDHLHRLTGTASNTELAKAIGADPVTLASVVSGRTSPSLGLISRIIVAFPELSLASVCAVA